jgi:hypothetical protein
MTTRTIAEILKDAGKQMPDPSAFGANDIILAAAIIAQALDRHTDAMNAVSATLKQIAERPRP